MRFRNQTGVTLIELIAAGVISSIVAIALLAIMRVQNDQIANSTNKLKLKRLFGVLSIAIQQEMRKGIRVLPPTINPGADDQPQGGLWEFYVQSVPPVVWGIRINSESGRVEEFRNGVGYIPFVIGGDTVRIATPIGPFSTPPFTIGPYGRYIEAKITLVNQTDTLFSPPLRVQCRSINIADGGPP